MPMPRPFRSVARALNPMVMPMARRMRPLAVVHHTGRKSGKAYQNPVMAFRTGEGWVIALAYGSDVQWVRNAEKAGTAGITQGGRRQSVGPVRRLDARSGAAMLPGWARGVMKMANVDTYVMLPAPAGDRIDRR